MAIPELKKTIGNVQELDLSLPYKVADLSLAELGQKEMKLAESEMPERNDQTSGG